MSLSPVAWALTVASVLAALSTYPFVATAIAYRRRDNGLSYILLVLGVGVWNGMFAAQVLSTRPLIQTFFLALAIVGGLLAGLGWFMFAGTASSTPLVPNQRLLFGGAALLVGVDVALAVTAPVHELYWVPRTAPAAAYGIVEPRLGYWLHTQLVLLLFAAGTVLFAAAWNEGSGLPYSRAYAVAGTATSMAVVGSNALAPGGLPVAPLAAASLTTIGWLQAYRGRIFDRLRARLE